MTTLEHIDVAKLWIDSSTQPRVAIDMETVSEYAEAMAAGGVFPPVVAYHDGGRYILADGFHRVLAAREAKIATLAVELHEGTIRDAVLYSVAANAEHGLRRTNADKRRAVERLLKDSEWAQWSNAEIARRCRVSPHTVASIREGPSLCNLHSEAEGAQGADQGGESATPPVAATERTYTTKHGTKSTMRTDKIGRAQKAGERLGGIARRVERRLGAVKKDLLILANVAAADGQLGRRRKKLLLGLAEKFAAVADDARGLAGEYDHD